VFLKIVIIRISRNDAVSAFRRDTRRRNRPRPTQRQLKKKKAFDGNDTVKCTQAERTDARDSDRRQGSSNGGEQFRRR